jgi:hypothetical protein
MTTHRISVRPECPRQRVYRGTSATLSPCHSERSEESGRTPSETVQRALARVLDPPDALAKFFACGELLLVYSDKK